MDPVTQGVIIGALSGAVLAQSANHLVNAGFEALATTSEITFLSLKGELSHSSNRYIIAVLNQLEAMDIDSKLMTVQSLVQSLEGDANRAPSDSAFKLQLEAVKQAVPPIKEVLMRVQQELQYHEQRYLASYRSPHTDELIDTLTRKLKVLDQRVDLLIKIANMNTRSSIAL